MERAPGPILQHGASTAATWNGWPQADRRRPARHVDHLHHQQAVALDEDNGTQRVRLADVRDQGPTRGARTRHADPAADRGNLELTVFAMANGLHHLAPTTPPTST